MEKYPPLDINLKSIPNLHHTRVKMSRQFESCLSSNRNTAVMLPYDKCWLNSLSAMDGRDHPLLN